MVLTGHVGAAGPSLLGAAGFVNGIAACGLPAQPAARTPAGILHALNLHSTILCYPCPSSPLLPPYLPQQSFAPVVHNSSGSFAWRPERPAAPDFVAQKWAWSGFTPGGAFCFMHHSARFWCKLGDSASLCVRAQLSGLQLTGHSASARRALRAQTQLIVDAPVMNFPPVCCSRLGCAAARHAVPV